MNNMHVRFWLSRSQGFDICCFKCSVSLSTQSIYIYTSNEEDILSLYVMNFDSLCAPVRVEFINRDEAGMKFTCYNNVVKAFEDYQMPYFKEI